MKANELMIGDWVQHPDGEGRILILALDGLYLEDKGGRCYACSYNKIQPIPLTKKILKKNFPWVEVIAWWPILDGLHCETRTDGDIMVSGNFRYIHQLQHALHLCGVDLDIVI